MSSNSESDAMSRCANCGVGEGDDIKLKTCTACKSVKYCGIKCQKQHRPKHKRDCKKRSAELKDEILFKQPESTCWGDCPICFLPMPLEDSERAIMVCCGKYVCRGCVYAQRLQDIDEGKAKDQRKCPFCRKMPTKSDAESWKVLMDRAAEMKCPNTLCEAGLLLCKKGEYKTAFDYYSRAAALGDLQAHWMLGEMYRDGKGVERSMSKGLSHTEMAAINGHPDARYTLGANEWNHGQHERAIKHLIIAAHQGENRSLEQLKEAFKHGLVSKDDFASALRGHQAAVDATKSPHREVAVEFERYEENMRHQDA